ncbi:MAG: metal-dependent hydrolase [Cyanobacteria bacterium J06592_8]
MPSPIAHAVTGYALSELFPLKSHPQYPEKRYNWHPFLAVFIAIFADFDFIPQLLTGERFHRGLTHSLIFAVGFSLIVGLWGHKLGKISALKLIRWTFFIYSSHLLLDIFTAGGSGVQIFSPFSEIPVQSQFPLFPPVHHSRGLFDLSHFIFISWELAYSGLVLIILRLWKKKQSQKYVE